MTTTESPLKSTKPTTDDAEQSLIIKDYEEVARMLRSDLNEIKDLKAWILTKNNKELGFKLNYSSVIQFKNGKHPDQMPSLVAHLLTAMGYGNVEMLKTYRYRFLTK